MTVSQPEATSNGNPLRRISADGLSIVGLLLVIGPDETIVYHVGDLARDRTDPCQAFRAGTVAAEEIEVILDTVESVVASGRCVRREHQITPGITVYTAVGTADTG